MLEWLHKQHTVPLSRSPPKNYCRKINTVRHTKILWAINFCGFHGARLSTKISLHELHTNQSMQPATNPQIYFHKYNKLEETKNFIYTHEAFLPYSSYTV